MCSGHYFPPDSLCLRVIMMVAACPRKGAVNLGLRFVFGRAGSGKSTLCLEEIRSELRQQPWGAPLLFLVPEQATYQMEVALANTPDLGGSLRAQVLSFQRLGWRVFSEMGGGQKILIGEMGKRMLLRQILLTHRLELKAFAHAATRPGMAELLAQVIGEFKTYQVTPRDLRNVSNAVGLLKDKLEDLALLYEAFQNALGEDTRDPDDELTVLAGKIAQAPLVQGTLIWIDGFKGFTPQELNVLRILITTAQDVVMTLPLDPVLLDISQQTAPEQLSAEEALFTSSWQTYQAVRRIVLETGAESYEPTFLTEEKRFKNAWLSHLEKHYNTYPTVTFASPLDTSNVSLMTSSNKQTNNLIYDPKNDLINDLINGPIRKPQTDGIQILSAVNRRAEVEGVARELRRLARDEGMRWSEMAIMSRDLAGYHELIAQEFSVYDIPHFLDHKRPILHHPLIELLLSITEAAQSHWAYEPLFRCLKTDFFPLERDAVDCLENVVIEHGFHGESWSNNQPWRIHRQWTLGQNEEQHQTELEIQAEINASRQTVYDLIAPFIQAVSPFRGDGPQPVRVITEALYSFMERLNVPASLKKWSEKEQAEGNLSEARLHEQIWDAVIDVFDEMVAGLGDTCLALDDYVLILASGLENLQLGLIPPGLDQVLVGSLDRSRNPEVRVLFLLGANDGILPARPASEGMLDAEEREQLEKAGVSLAPKGKAQMDEEQFFIYTALTRASEKLFVSYPLTDEEGKGLTVSPVVTRLKHLFPKLSDIFLGKSEDLERLSHPDSALQAYAEQRRTLRLGEPLSPLWQAVERWLTLDPQRQHQVKLLQGSLMARNQEGKISRPLARRLYGKRLKASVSRLEQFARCPFAHYARYGLKLRERTTHELSSPDMGQFFHALLHDFALRLREQGLDWGKLTKEESWALVSELADHLAPGVQHEILLSSARYRYLTYKLKRTVHHAIRVLGEHARKGIFIPIQLEVRFGPSETLQGVNVPLTEGNSLLLSGQIDRVDAAFLDGQVYLRVLDYKSRELSLSLDSIYYGLNLQLLTYLDVALQGAEVLLSTTDIEETPLESTRFEIAAAQDITKYNTVPAGFLYFPVLEPQLEEKNPLSAEALDVQRIKAIKVRGYLLANPNVLQAMDSSFVTGQSDLLGLKLNKDGAFKKGSNVLTEDQFSVLRAYLHQWFQQAGEKIFEGEIGLSPYRRGKTTGCQYCAFKSVCHFDPYLPENQYRELPLLKQEELWNCLKEQVGKNIESGNVNGNEGINMNSLEEAMNTHRHRHDDQELQWLTDDEDPWTDKSAKIDQPRKQEGGEDA